MDIYLCTYIIIIIIYFTHELSQFSVQYSSSCLMCCIHRFQLRLHVNSDFGDFSAIFFCCILLNERKKTHSTYSLALKYLIFLLLHRILNSFPLWIASLGSYMREEKKKKKSTWRPCDDVALKWWYIYWI